MLSPIERLSLLSSLVATAAHAQYIPPFLSSGGLSGTSFGIAAHNATFDYVIVGGGLAGSVVANRLLAGLPGGVTVAVVEPGSFYETTNGNNSQVPYYSTKWIQSDPDDYQPLVDWSLTTEPIAGADNAKIHYAQGKCFGGSSGRNQMIYHRGTVGAYKRWAEQVGDDAYLWKNILPYFEKSTNFTPPPPDSLRAANASAPYQAAAYTRTGGPLHVSFPNWANPLSSYGAAAFGAIGLPAAKDFSSGVLHGYGYNPFTIDPQTGLRSSSATSFLAQALSDSAQRTSGRLQLYPLTQAHQVLFDSSKHATGVKVRSAGYDYVLSARREVILSAGAWHSPQLLMLSGIGPTSTLRAHGIPVVADRPGVGQGMWDTTNVGGVTHKVSIPTDGELEKPGVLQQNIDAFLANRTGFLANFGGDFLAWGRLPNATIAKMSSAAQDWLNSLPLDWPHIEYSISSTAGNIAGQASSTTNYGTIGVLLIAAKSRGNMTIRSNSILDAPVINPNWLLDPVDGEVAVEGVKLARKAWSAIAVRDGVEVKPGANATTDAQILKALRKDVTPIHHASSSCKMAKASDPMAVVDSKARVIGVTGLRVIDSSSLAFTPPGHTQGYTYAHAEKLVQDVIAATH